MNYLQDDYDFDSEGDWDYDDCSQDHLNEPDAVIVSHLMDELENCPVRFLRHVLLGHGWTLAAADLAVSLLHQDGYHPYAVVKHLRLYMLACDDVAGRVDGAPGLVIRLG